MIGIGSNNNLPTMRNHLFSSFIKYKNHTPKKTVINKQKIAPKIHPADIRVLLEFLYCSEKEALSPSAVL